MSYVVLYDGKLRRVEPVPKNEHYITPAAQEVTSTILRMAQFTDEQAAIDFAKKNDGVILIPAEIKSEVVSKEK
jgi:nitrous oxide reductase accessory protein NosL